MLSVSVVTLITYGVWGDPLKAGRGVPKCVSFGAL